MKNSFETIQIFSLNWMAAAVMALALGVATPAWSHHSHAMFDHSKPATVTGTVKEFVFRNPHVYLYVDGKNEKGEVVTYWIEMSSGVVMPAASSTWAALSASGAPLPSP